MLFVYSSVCYTTHAIEHVSSITLLSRLKIFIYSFGIPYIHRTSYNLFHIYVTSRQSNASRLFFFFMIPYIILIPQATTMPTFQSDIAPTDYQPGSDPANAMQSMHRVQKLDILLNPEVESIILIHNKEVRQLFLPKCFTVPNSIGQYEKFVFGFFGEDPTNTTLVKIPAYAFESEVLSYVSFSETQSIKIGTDSIPQDFFDNNSRPDMNHIAIGLLVRWIPKCKGHRLPTFPLSAWEAARQSFEDMHQFDYLMAMYLRSRIETNNLINPSTVGTATCFPAGHDDAALHIVTPDIEMPIEYILDNDSSIPTAIWEDMQKARSSFLAPHVDLTTQPDDRSLLSIATPHTPLYPPPHTTTSIHTPTQSITKTPTKSATTTIHQVLMWQSFGGVYHNGSFRFPAPTNKYNKILSHPKDQRLSYFLQVLASKQKGYTSSSNVIRNRCRIPPINALSGNFLIQCIFQKEHDNEFERGLSLWNFKVPDKSSVNYTSHCKDANIVSNEDLVGEESTKRTSKTTQPYSAGSERTHWDILGLVANLSAIFETFIEVNFNSEGNPEPTLLTYMHRFAALLLVPQFEPWLNTGIRAGKAWILHSIIYKMNKLFTQWANITSDVDFTDSAEQHLNGTNPSFIFDITPFNVFNNHAELILTGIHQDITLGEYQSVATAPPSFSTTDAEGDVRAARRQRTRRESSGPAPNNRGSHSSKGLFAPLSTDTRPFVRLPPNCRFCIAFVLVGQSCHRGADCTYEHVLCRAITKEQGAHFTRAWFEQNKVKPTSEFSRHLQSLSSSSSSSSNSTASRNTTNAQRNTPAANNNSSIVTPGVSPNTTPPSSQPSAETSAPTQ